jgi:hypothetical protein
VRIRARDASFAGGKTAATGRGEDILAVVRARDGARQQDVDGQW